MKLVTNRSGHPRTIDESNWFYTDKARSITFVHEVRDKRGKYVQTDLFVLPLRILEDYLKVKA